MRGVAIQHNHRHYTTMAKTNVTKSKARAGPFSRPTRDKTGGVKKTAKKPVPKQKSQKHKDSALLDLVNDPDALKDVYSVKSKETLKKEKSEALLKQKEEEREKRLVTKKELEKQMDDLASFGL